MKSEVIFSLGCSVMDCKCRFSQHEFTTANPKGGSQTMGYKNPTFSWAGDCIKKNDCHTNGVYLSNPLKPFPPF